MKIFTLCIVGVAMLLQAAMEENNGVVWCCVLGSGVAGCCYMLVDSLILYKKKPISITLQNTDYPLNKFPFPTVSVCPITKVNMTYFTDYFKREVGDHKWERDIEKFYEILNSFVHPYISTAVEALEELNSSSFLQAVQHVNITKLMYSSFPKCESIFKKCNWNGDYFDCCDGFKLIRSEDGFCFSFNTLMEDLQTNCRFPGTPRDNNVKFPEKCRLKYTWLTGTMSGLEVVFQQHNTNDLFYVEANFPVFKIYIHCAHELPEPGMGFLFSLGDKSKVGVSVKPRIIQTPFDGIENELPEVRNCLIPLEEEKLKLTTLYSQSSCVMQCRADLIYKACNCSSHHFRFDGIEDCRSTSLLCVANYSRYMNEKLFTVDAKENTFCGRTCFPKCSEVTYSYTTDREDVFNIEDEGVLEVYFRNEGALHYIRQLTFSRQNLIVNLGGVVGLFLGGSIISFLEMLYWISKIIFEVTLSRSKVTSVKPLPPPSSVRRHIQSSGRRNTVANAWYD